MPPRRRGCSTQSHHSLLRISLSLRSLSSQHTLTHKSALLSVRTAPPKIAKRGRAPPDSLRRLRCAGITHTPLTRPRPLSLLRPPSKKPLARPLWPAAAPGTVAARAPAGPRGPGKGGGKEGRRKRRRARVRSHSQNTKSRVRKHNTPAFFSS
jgi:hypothetical protein